jgi:hypothetical protein
MGSSALTAAPVGVIYLAHLDERIGSGAQHYLGWTSNLEAREEAHRNGRGAKLLREARRLGVDWRVVRTWDGKTRTDERGMKRGGSLARFCPQCCKAYRKKRNEQQRARRALYGRADRPRGNPRGPLSSS